MCEYVRFSVVNKVFYLKILSFSLNYTFYLNKLYWTENLSKLHLRIKHNQMYFTDSFVPPTVHFLNTEVEYNTDAEQTLKEDKEVAKTIKSGVRRCENNQASG